MRDEELLLLNNFNRQTLVYKSNHLKKIETFSNSIKEIAIFTELIEYKDDVLIAIGNYDKTITMRSLCKTRPLISFQNVHKFIPLNLYYFKTIDIDHCFTTGDFEIRIWDFTTGLCVNVLSGHKESTYILNDLSEFKQGLFSCSDYNYDIKIWNYLKKEIVINCGGAEDFIRFSIYNHKYHAGHLYTCGNEPFARVWHINTGECQRKLQVHKEGILQMEFISNSLIVTVATGSENTIKIWNFHLDICMKTVNLGGNCRKILYNDNLDIILTFVDKKILYFDIKNPVNLYYLAEKHKNAVTDIILNYSKDTLFSVGLDKLLITWMLKSVNE